MSAIADNGHCLLPVELRKDEAGNLLLVKEETVNATLEKILAGGGLARETVKTAEHFLPLVTVKSFVSIRSRAMRVGTTR